MKSRSRPFYPPKLNPRFVWLLQRIAPSWAHWVYQIDLIIGSEPLVQLQALQEQTCVLLCNHPTFDDPVVMFLLSAYLGEPFYYLTAYEQFVGWKGQIYQHLGAYSIQRGVPDRSSIVQTLGLLAQPNCKLMVFPEGGCSFQNDTVMPFRSGAVQIGLQAIARQVKQGNPAPDLYIVPISLKYRYSGRMIPVIEKTLHGLEAALGITATGDYYQRLRMTAAQVLRRFEQEYSLTSTDPTNWNQRITNLKTQAIQQCEQQLGLTFAIGESNRERAYRIRHALESRQVTLLANGTDGWDVMSRAMSRILNFDAIYDGYVAEKPTPERFLDTLIRLEREVFSIDEPRAKGHRQAFLRVGKPINLKDYFEAYSNDRSATITSLVEQSRQTIQQNLDILSEATARGISW
ncbi:MAG: 1-acyl-sn-glycerol-3-phosphate acyltransferase [Cyanobacteria bacterium CRU_2_1]|nr:1-acyl-sn-glycerol-3-phosphate acyltransferase [Cyanobacteria bacterium RU_5_0]NJR60421.1 1-acyl-sn-glycerol-3-phosphate acyltransferase [Cyanobacteria bacterium CRU_2_1]